MRKNILLLILILCSIWAFIVYKEVLFKHTALIKDWFFILQSFVIIIATIFTAWWAYKTFAHKEKIEELKRLKATVELYHFKLTVFCAQIRQTDEPDKQELSEKLELGQIHNKLALLSKTNLYNRKEFRKKIQSIVGKWLCNEQIRNMQRERKTSPPEEKIKETWQKFNEEYEQVLALIDKEAKKYIA